MATETSKSEQALSQAEKLTPLQLNAIKLDAKHTVLTPDYLENLLKNRNQSAAGTQQS